MLKENYLHLLLQAIYEKGELNLFDHAAGLFSQDSQEFAEAKEWAGQLIHDKMAKYADEQHTVLTLTNYGRYWIVKGGYEAFLQTGHLENKKHKTYTKEELLEARLRLTHFRLIGFWLTIIISLLGFGLSIYNLIYILNHK